MISIRNAAKPVRHNHTSVRSNMFAHRRMYVNIPLYSGDEENMAKTNVHVRWEANVRVDTYKYKVGTVGKCVEKLITYT